MRKRSKSLPIDNNNDNVKKILSVEEEEAEDLDLV